MVVLPMQICRDILVLFAISLFACPQFSYAIDDDEEPAEEKIIADCSFGPTYSELNSKKSFDRIKFNGGDTYKDDFLGLSVHLTPTLHRYMTDFFNQDILEEYELNPKKNIKGNSECKQHDFFCPLEQVFGNAEYVKKLFLLRDSYAINASYWQNLSVDQESVIKWESDELSELILIASMVPSQLFEFIHAGGVSPITVILVKDSEMIDEHEATESSEYVHRKAKLFTVEDHTIYFYSNWKKMTLAAKKSVFMKAFSRLMDLEFKLIESKSWQGIDHVNKLAMVGSTATSAAYDFWESFAAYRLFPKRFFDQPDDSDASTEKKKKYEFMKTVFNGYEFRRSTACDNETQIVTYTDFLGQKLLKERFDSFAATQGNSLTQAYVKLEKLCGDLLLQNMLNLDLRSGSRPMDSVRNMHLSDEALDVEEELEREEEREEINIHEPVHQDVGNSDALPLDIFIKKEKHADKELTTYQIRKAQKKKERESAKASSPQKERKFLNALATPIGVIGEGIYFVAEKIQRGIDLLKADVNLNRFKKEGYFGKYKYLDYRGARELWFEKKTHERSIMDDYFMCIDRTLVDSASDLKVELPPLLTSNPYGEVTFKYFYMERSKDLFFREPSMQINMGSLGFTHQWFFEKAGEDIREKISIFVFSTLFEQAYSDEKFSKLDILQKNFSNDWRDNLGSYYEIYNLIIKMYFFQFSEEARKIRLTYDPLFKNVKTVHSPDLKDLFETWHTNISEVTQRGDISNMHSVHVDELSFDGYNQKISEEITKIKKNLMGQRRELGKEDTKEEKSKVRADIRDDLLFIQYWISAMDQMNLNAAMIKQSLALYFTPVLGNKSKKKFDPTALQTY